MDQKSKDIDLFANLLFAIFVHKKTSNYNKESPKCTIIVNYHKKVAKLPQKKPTQKEMKIN